MIGVPPFSWLETVAEPVGRLAFMTKCFLLGQYTIACGVLATVPLFRIVHRSL